MKLTLRRCSPAPCQLDGLAFYNAGKTAAPANVTNIFSLRLSRSTPPESMRPFCLRWERLLRWAK